MRLALGLGLSLAALAFTGESPADTLQLAFLRPAASEAPNPGSAAGDSTEPASSARPTPISDGSPRRELAASPMDGASMNF